MLIPLTSVRDAGVAIRTMRKRAGIRIDDFALIAGVSKQFMTDLENGKPTVQMGKVLGLLQRMAIGVSLDLSDDAVDRYKAELEKATSPMRLRKLPKNAAPNQEAEVIILFSPVSTHAEKLALMQEAMSDPLFLADLEEVPEDFRFAEIIR